MAGGRKPLSPEEAKWRTCKPPHISNPYSGSNWLDPGAMMQQYAAILPAVPQCNHEFRDVRVEFYYLLIFTKNLHKKKDFFFLWMWKYQVTPLWKNVPTEKFHKKRLFMLALRKEMLRQKDRTIILKNPLACWIISMAYNPYAFHLLMEILKFVLKENVYK